MIGPGRRWPVHDPAFDVLHQTWVGESATGVYRLDIFRGTARRRHLGSAAGMRRSGCRTTRSSAATGRVSRTWFRRSSCFSRRSTAGRRMKLTCAGLCRCSRRRPGTGSAGHFGGCTRAIRGSSYCDRRCSSGLRPPARLPAVRLAGPPVEGGSHIVPLAGSPVVRLAGSPVVRLAGSPVVRLAGSPCCSAGWVARRSAGWVACRSACCGAGESGGSLHDARGKRRRHRYPAGPTVLAILQVTRSRRPVGQHRGEPGGTLLRPDVLGGAAGLS